MLEKCLLTTLHVNYPGQCFLFSTWNKRAFHDDPTFLFVHRCVLVGFWFKFSSRLASHDSCGQSRLSGRIGTRSCIAIFLFPFTLLTDCISETHIFSSYMSGPLVFTCRVNRLSGAAWEPAANRKRRAQRHQNKIQENKEIRVSSELPWICQQLSAFQNSDSSQNVNVL